ncbi:MAG TPA: ATP-binding protein [Thermoanaerobaculia bacterium]|nr:ATP-binding protein [Thermoanaerobaculia bacterium]
MDEITSYDDISSWLAAHQTLWRLDEFRSLSRFHACIDAADVKIENKTCTKEPIDPDGLTDFVRKELTSFGCEVGADVPRWWVFAREPNVPEFWNGTKQLFPIAQRLVRSAERLCRRPAPNYEHIIQELAAFLRSHASEIESFLAYADHLSAKHKLAPAILFSYAVWGSTKRGDRTLDGCTAKGATRLRLAGEMALGIHTSNGPTLFRVWMDLLDEAYEAAGEEGYPWVSASPLLHMVQIRIRENVVAYFTELRDSLRHIDTLCQEFLQREYLYADDRFAIRLLKKISGQKSTVENDLWDIKEALGMWSAQQPHKEAATIEFVEDVAAFANNRGGVLIIGVTNDTHEIVGVDKPENRIKKIEAVIRKYADAPIVDFARVRAVPFAGVTRPCIIIVVGRTDTPIGVRQPNNNYSYPLRVGSGKERVSQKQISATKAHMKGTEFKFASELEAWVSDVV